MISSNIGGYTKKSVTSSMVFAAYCLGNFAGPMFIFESEKPVYRSGTYAMSEFLSPLAWPDLRWASSDGFDWPRR